MGTKTLLTLEEYAELSEEERDNYVYDEGELIPVPYKTWRHGLAIAWLTIRIGNFTANNPIGKLVVETNFLLAPAKIRRPDMAFVREERLVGIEEDRTPGAVGIVPDLAIEFLSPSETAMEFDDKIELYLDSGVEEIWAFHLQSRRMRVWRKDSNRKLTDKDTLTSELLPGFSLPLRELFDAVK